MLGRPFGVPAEPVGGVGRRPAAGRGEPPGRGEVAVGDDRGDPVLEAGADHPPVVVEGGPGEGARLGLDPGPLEREAVGVEPQVGHRGDVLGIAVVVVAGVQGRLGEQRVLGPLQGPEVGVHVAALDLVPGRGRAPQEPVGEGRHGPQDCPSGSNSANLCRPCSIPTASCRPIPASAASPARCSSARVSLPIVSPHGHLDAGLVRRRSTDRRPGRRAGHPGPLPAADALQPGRAARGARRRPARRLRRGRRRPQHLAHLRRALPPVPGDPVEAVARPHAVGGLRHQRAAVGGRHADATYDHLVAAPGRRRLPAPGPLRALRHRVPGHDRRRPRPPRRPTPRSRRAAGAAGSCPRSGPTTSSTPTARTSRTTSTGSASSPARTPRRGRVTSPRSGPGAGPSSPPGATATDHGHPSAAHRRPPPGRGRGPVPPRTEGGGRARRRRAVPRPDARRDGGHEPGGRSRAPAPRRLLAAATTRRSPTASARTWAPTSPSRWTTSGA